MSEHTRAVDPEAWAAAQVEEVVRELEQKPKRKRRKVRGVFLKPGKEAGVWWIRWWGNYGHRHMEAGNHEPRSRLGAAGRTQGADPVLDGGRRSGPSMSH